MADFFVSYTKRDSVKAKWIAQELEAIGHVPHVHESEIGAGENIYRWMEERHNAADHVLCVISDAYLKAPYSTLERDAAIWQAAAKRPGFMVPVVVEPCSLPSLLDLVRRCELFGLDEATARETFRSFISRRLDPDVATPWVDEKFAVSNVGVPVPPNFVGRESALAAIDEMLGPYDGKVAIAVLHGLRGVGKTVLAAAYADRHRGDYRATWWIRANTPASLRADFVALGVRLKWVGTEHKEDDAVAAVIERLRHEGKGILLIYDNVPNAAELMPYLPPGGQARVLVTSNDYAWRGLAHPIEIKVWPPETGSEFLIARTALHGEGDAALALSAALGGLPLAHEQAAAYCERLGVSLAEYGRRFASSPARLLDKTHGPASYRDGFTVAKTFALAIEEAAKLHPAAEPLIAHLALLAPEQIPLFLLSEAREQLGAPLDDALDGDGLDETIAALRAFALLDRETATDERDPAIATDTIRLHRLVRMVAVERRDSAQRTEMRRALVAALAAVHSEECRQNPSMWPRARRLDAIALDIATSDPAALEGPPMAALLMGLAGYRHTALFAYAEAGPLYERALAIRATTLGPEHRDTAITLIALAALNRDSGVFEAARALCERALAIFTKLGGPENADVAMTLNNLAIVSQEEGNLEDARALYERAVDIYSKVRGPDHADTATSLLNLGSLLQRQGKSDESLSLLNGALGIFEKVYGKQHPSVATSLCYIAAVLRTRDLDGALAHYQRAASIYETVLGEQHPHTGAAWAYLADLYTTKGDAERARSLYERAGSIYETAFGSEHAKTKRVRMALQALAAAAAGTLPSRAETAAASSRSLSKPGPKARQ